MRLPDNMCFWMENIRPSNPSEVEVYFTPEEANCIKNSGFGWGSRFNRVSSAGGLHNMQIALENEGFYKTEYNEKEARAILEPLYESIDQVPPWKMNPITFEK